MPERMVNVGILGAGGLGRSMVALMQHKPHLRLAAICESAGVAICADGLELAEVIAAAERGSVATVSDVGRPSEDSIGDVIAAGEALDAIFVALPNLPNSFVPDVAARFAAGGFSGVMVDALKRTTAVELMLEQHDTLRDAGITYVTGGGATPGLLTAAAALAAQSFVEVSKVELYFGVGIANWDAYRATIREDIAHLPGFDVERAQAMSEDEITEELNRRGGILELVDMEHADDVMLERAGICDRYSVTVGGVVDTRHPEKPVSTNVKIHGRTFEGKESHHTFTLGDETSMAANVCGPALGYMNAGLWLHDRGIFGVFTAAELMPRMQPPRPVDSDQWSVASETKARVARAF